MIGTKSISLCALLFPTFIWAQQFSGVVLSKKDHTPLKNVTITQLNHTVAAKTNAYGVFNLAKSGTYIFFKSGYLTDTVSINSTTSTIYLKEPQEYLKEITISTNTFKSNTYSYSGAVTLLSHKELALQNSINLAPVLNSVSGVLMQNGTLNTNKITIRGIGSRTLFGTSKIRSYFGNIPLTNGSGESNVDDLDLEAMAKLEITKGPSSSKYGAGLGGVIHWIPKINQSNLNMVQSNFSIGSYGLQKINLGGALSFNEQDIQIQYTKVISDGYRDNNSLNKNTITLASKHQINDRNQLIFLANLIAFKAYIPSSLNKIDYDNSPKKAAYTWEASKGNEDYNKGLLGLTWQHDFKNQSRWTTSIFGSIFQSDEDRPFNILNEKTNAFGLRTKWVNNYNITDKNLNLAIGAEYFNDRKDYQTYENLYQDFPPGTGSVKGDLLSNLIEHRRYTNIFLESQFYFTTKIIFEFGLNWNYTTYNLDDLFHQEPLNQSGQYNFKHIISPKFGLVYKYLKNHMLYASVSHGFSPPTLEETLLPNGLINPNIKPESGWNFELGSRGSIPTIALEYALALYHMPVKNQLVARRVGDDQFIGINAGQTNFSGIELDLNYTILQNHNITLKHRNALSYNLFKFIDFQDFKDNYSGNQVTGTPKSTFFSLLNLQTILGLYGNIQYNYVGKTPITDDNKVFSDSYQLIHFKLGYQRYLFKHLNANIYLGVNNVFNEKYAPMLQINASGFGGNLPRYYYPGEATNFYFGANFSYQF